MRNTDKRCAVDDNIMIFYQLKAEEGIRNVSGYDAASGRGLYAPCFKKSPGTVSMIMDQGCDMIVEVDKSPYQVASNKSSRSGDEYAFLGR